MANKRMFSLQIVDTDAFLDMPVSTQLLYFHLVMRADDDGFVGNPKKIIRLVGTGEDDIKVLISKRFILSFESGVVVIKHWLIHNTIRMDRFNETAYLDEKKQLIIKHNKAYTTDVNHLATTWQPLGNHLATQVKLSKVKLSKNTAKAITSADKPKIKKTSPIDNKEPITLETYVQKMRESPQRHVRLIGEYADQIRPKNVTRGQWHVFTKRNLRASRELSPFSDEQIEKAYKKIEENMKTKENPKGYITKWTLETLLDFMNE